METQVGVSPGQSPVKVEYTLAVAPSVRTAYPELTMVKTLTRSGNSLALVIDNPLLEATGITADSQLEVSTDGDVIVISPVRSKKRTAKLKVILDDLDRKHAGVFKGLAE